ncbi:MAG: TolC family protein [Pirellulaceae bacterium]|jgi:outer membrane protein TolC|nr:TolC family protein [Pirellulaceae bacterium]
MNRPLQRLVALMLIMLLTATGCAPTQPFYLHEDGDLSHYVATVTELENPDVDQVALEEVTQANPPLTLSEADFNNFRDITLEECVTIALQNSKVIRNLGSLTQFAIADGLVGRTGASATVYDPAVFESDPQFGVEAALSEFDAQFTTNVFWEKTDRPQNFGGFVGQTIFSNFFRRDQGTFNAELSKRTATGTTFAVRNETVYEQNNNPSRGLPSDWTAIMSVSATQPLLRGNGAQVNRAPLVLSRIRTDIVLADFEAAVRNMLLDLENSYWDLQFAYRLLETAKIGRDSALGTWRREYELTKGGKGTSQAEAQSREQYFFFRSQAETSLRDLFVAENRLRWLMGIAATDTELLRPIDRPSLARIEYDWNASHAESLVRTAELRRQRWQVKQRETELIVARNQLLPQLDLVARYSWLGVGDELIVAPRRGLNFINADPDDATQPINPGVNVPVGAPTPGSVAWDELTEGRFQEFSVGLQFTPPRIGARREMAGVRNAELSLAREKARLEDMELNVSHLLTTAIQNLDFNYQVAQTHFNRWVATEQEVDSLLALVMGGASTSDKGNPIDLLLNSQRRRANAQADFYRAVAEYNKSIANVHFRKGSLLEYNNIQLAEGPWPQKAYWDALGRARERDASLYLDYGVTRPGVASRGPVAQFWHPTDESHESLAPDATTSPELLPETWPETDERMLEEYDGPALDAASINPSSPAPLAPVPPREDVDVVPLPLPQAATPAPASPAPDRHAVTHVGRTR